MLIRLAIYNDVMATSMGDDKQEVREIMESLSSRLDGIDLVEHENYFNPNVNADLVVIDFGGQLGWGCDSLVESCTQDFIDYLENHPSTLGVVWSNFYANYIKASFDKQFEKLNNLCFHYMPSWISKVREDEDDLDQFETKLKVWFGIPLKPPVLPEGIEIPLIAPGEFPEIGENNDEIS